MSKKYHEKIDRFSNNATIRKFQIVQKEEGKYE